MGRYPMYFFLTKPCFPTALNDSSFHNKFARLVSFLTAVLIHVLLLSEISNAQNLNLQDLTEAVKDMCVHPDRHSSYLRIEGDANAGGFVRLINLGISGEITYEQYDGIIQKLDQYSTDPRKCTIEVLSILVPALSNSNRQLPLPPSLSYRIDRCDGCTSPPYLYFSNDGGRLFDLELDAVGMAYVMASRDDCTSSNTQIRFPHDVSGYGWNEDRWKDPFYFEIGLWHEFLPRLIEETATKYNTRESCVRIGTTIILRATFSDELGANHDRYFQIPISATSAPHWGQISSGGKSDFHQWKEWLSAYEERNSIISLDINRIHNEYNYSWSWQ